MKSILFPVVLLSIVPCLAQTPFVTGVNTTAPLRNNYSGNLGFAFTLANSPIFVSSLGRIYISGNTGTHTVMLVDASTNSPVSGAVVSITMTAGTPNAFQYVALAAPVQLAVNHSYYLVSQETTSGDQWYDVAGLPGTSLVPGNAVYTDAAGNYVSVAHTVGSAYVPPNMLYTLGTAPEPHTITVTAPTNGEAITGSGYFDFTATLTPNDAPFTQNFVFSVDGQAIESPQFPSNYLANPELYSYNFDITQLTNGPHIVTGTYLNGNPFGGTGAQTSPSVNFTVTGGSNPLVTSQTPGPARNNFSGYVGMAFQTPATQVLQLTTMGRYVLPGNSGSHQVKLVDGITGVDVPGASVTLDLSNAPQGRYVYSSLSSPLSLTLNHAYYLLDQETAGGDSWYDVGPVITNNIAVIGPVYQAPGATYTLVPYAGYSYVPVNLGLKSLGYDVGPLVSITSPTQNTVLPNSVFNVQVSATPGNSTTSILSVQLIVDGKAVGSPAVNPSAGVYNLPLDPSTLASGSHTLAASATDSLGGTALSAPVNVQVNSSGVSYPGPFISAFTPTFLRNNFSGLVGMQFTVGSAAITVSSLGRYCVPGNSGTHSIALYSVSAPSSAYAQSIVNLAGCTAGGYVYASLATPVALTAGASYYVADVETAGGDQWYDYAPVISSSAATVTGAVYSVGTSGVFNAVPAASTGYGPLNFLYITPTGSTGSLVASITNVVPGPQPTVTVSATANSAITSVQILVDGYSNSPALTSPPYSQMLPSLNLSQHAFTAVVKDAAGDVVTTAPVTATLTLSPPSQPGEFFSFSLVSLTQGTLRSNYSGWVGFQFTTGSSYTFPGTTVTVPITLPSIVGRVCVAGNSSPHLVKIVLASTGVDVPGAASWINCGAPGSVNPIGLLGASLNVNTTYYLVSQEVAGGDQFTDIASAVPILGEVVGGPGSGIVPFFSGFTIDGPVYFDGAKYVLVPLPNYGYASVFLGGISSLI